MATKEEPTIRGFGFCGFGQFSLSLVKAVSNSKDSKIPRVIDRESSVNCSITEKNKPLLSVAAIDSLHIYSTWDSIFIYTSGRDSSASYSSAKWLPLLSRLTQNTARQEQRQGFLSSNELITRVWELIDSSLYIQTNLGHCYHITSQDTIKLTDSPLLQHYWSFNSMGGTGYCLTQSGDLYSKHCLSPLIDGGLPLMTKVSYVANGSNHAVLLMQNGLLYSFGVGTHGQLGLGDLSSRDYPTLIEGLAGLPVSAVAAGDWHSLAVSEYGDVYSWGWNRDKQLGHSHTHSVVAEPCLVEEVPPPDETIIKVSCGCRHSCALAKSGQCYFWGWNGYGQIPQSKESTVTVPIVMESVYDIYCNHWTTALLTV